VIQEGEGEEPLVNYHKEPPSAQEPVAVSSEAVVPVVEKEEDLRLVPH